MRFRIATALLFVAMFWNAAVSSIPRATPGLVSVLGLILGVSVLSWCGFGHVQRRYEVVSSLVAPVCLLAALLVSDWVLATGLLCTGLGASLCRANRARGFVSALAFSGSALILVGALSTIFPYVAVRARDVQAFYPAVAALLRLAGIDSEWGNQAMAIWGPSGQPVVRWSLERFTPLMLLFFIAIPLARRAVYGRVRPTMMLWEGFGVCAYALLRGVALTMVAIDLQRPELVFDNRLILVSWLPAVLILREPRELDFSVQETGVHRWTKSRLAVTFASLAVTVAVGTIVPRGESGSGRILVDEFHSDWAWTDEPTNTEQYGARSTYNYAAMFQFLPYYFSAVDRSYERITKEVLSGYDVFIVKMPTARFDADEHRVIDQFVLDGGGLWLIGDHTNVFGTSDCLNELSRKYGIEFIADSLDEIDRQHRQVLRRPGLLAHPSVVGVPPMRMETSCSLAVGGDASVVLYGDDLHADRASYRADNFFGDHKLDTSETYGVFAQMATAESGLGRVVCFSDSTVFSTFDFFFPGRWELCISTVSWLNGKACGDCHFWIRAASVLVAGVLLTVMVLRGPPGVWVSALVLGCWLSGHVNGYLYAIATERIAVPVVAFECDNCSFRNPGSPQRDSEELGDYESLFVNSFRVGWVPRVVEDVEGAVEAQCVVFVRPRIPFKATELRRLEEYIRHGGQIVVIDGGADIKESTSDDLLDKFGLALVPATEPVWLNAEALVEDVAGAPPIGIAHCVWVEGGVPVIRDSAGRPVVSMVRYGLGSVIVCGTADLFTSEAVGGVREKPSVEQRACAELGHILLRDLVLMPAVRNRQEADGSEMSGGQRD